MRPIKKASTNESVVIKIIDSTTGLPETAVEHNTSGIALWYRREGATQTAITEAALAALDTAHTDGGIEHMGDGYYRLDPPDAAFATGCNGVQFGGTVTGMIVIGCYVPLVDYDPYDTVRLGLTALPNAAADAAGGLPISDAGGLDLDTQIGTDIDAILVDTGTTLQAELDAIQAAVITNAAGADVAADIIALKAETALIVADTNELQGDWTNTGRLDTILDSILTDTGTTLQAELDAIQAAVITNAAGADVAADIIALKAETALIVADTNELQGDWANAGRLDAILDIIAADTTTDIPALIATAQADLDIITGAAGVVIADGAITAAKLGADCITAAKVAADVHTENGVAVMDATEAITGQTHSLETMMARIYRFMLNKMVITNATGAVALRNEADNADIMTQTVTDNATLTNRTAGGWA